MCMQQCHTCNLDKWQSLLTVATENPLLEKLNELIRYLEL